MVHNLDLFQASKNEVIDSALDLKEGLHMFYITQSQKPI